MSKAGKTDEKWTHGAVFLDGNGKLPAEHAKGRVLVDAAEIGWPGYSAECVKTHTLKANAVDHAEWAAWYKVIPKGLCDATRELEKIRFTINKELTWPNPPPEGQLGQIWRCLKAVVDHALKTS